MTDDTGDKLPQRAPRQSELLPAILAVALAVASQLAVRDGLTLLGLAGYVTAAWLFVASVRSRFDASPLESAPQESTPPDEISLDKPAVTIDSASRLSFLRQNWRQVTLAEIFAGDIPPARLVVLEPNGAEIADDRISAELTGSIAPEPEAIEDAPPAGPVVAAAHVSTWSADDSAASSPKAVKVTPQGDVLVLDTGLEQVQRFDEQGNLLATYHLSGFTGVKVLDLDVSPDGQTLYVLDAASGHLQVIAMSREGLTAGDVGGEFEEE